MPHEPFDSPSGGGSSSSTVTAGTGSEEGEEDFPDDYFDDDGADDTSGGGGTTDTTDTTDTRDTTTRDDDDDRTRSTTRDDDDDDDDRTRPTTRTKEDLEEELGREPIEESEVIKDVPEDTRSADAETTPLSETPPGDGSTQTTRSITREPTDVGSGVGPLDPTDPRSPAGTAVTGTEAAAVAAGEIDVYNLEDKPALVSALARQGYPDIRGEDVSSEVDRGLDEGDLTAWTASGGLRIEFTEEGRRQAKKRAKSDIERQLEEELGIDIDPEDINVGGSIESGFTGRLSEDYQRERATEQLDARLEAQTGLDLEPGVDYRVERTAEGYEARLTETGQERYARTQQRRPTGAATTGPAMGDLIQSPTGERAPSTPLERLDTAVDAQVGMDLQPGEDYVVERTPMEGGGMRMEASLTDEGRAKARGDEFESGATIPVPWFVNPDGEPTGVPGFVESDVGEQTARDAQQEIRARFDAAAEAAAPFSPLVLAERAGTEIREARAENRTPDPMALVTEPETEGAAERQAEAAVGGGAASVVGAPIGISLAAEETREFVAEGRQRQREQGSAATRALYAEEVPETAGQVGAQIGQQLASPTGRAELAGSLLFTAGAMGAAGAVSKTAGAATRFAIQPGEELLTAGATRAAPGVASRFPGGRIDWEEPLIYGSAAAARRTGRAARAGVQRARSVAGRTRVEPRAGAGLVPPRLRITAADLSSERATADPPGESRRIFDSPENVPRDPTKAGLDEQGAFVGSYTHASDPAFGGTGKPGAGRTRDFSRVRETNERLRTELPPYLSHRQDLKGGAEWRLEQARRPAVEAPIDEPGADPFAAFAVAEETERVETAQASSFDNGGAYDAQTSATMRDRLEAASAASVGGITAASVTEAEQSRLEAASEPATTLRDRLASRTATETRQETPTRTETAQGVESRQDQETELGLELAEVGIEGLDVETEAETDTPTELVTGQEYNFPRPEVATPGDDPQPFTPFRITPPRLGPPGEPVERPTVLEPGWLREEFVDIATGGSIATFGLRPSQEALEAAPWEQRLTGSLPTGVEVLGTPGQKRRVGNVRDFFTSTPGEGLGDFTLDFDLDFDVGWSP